MTEEQIKAIKALEEAIPYFKHHSTNNSRFYPEYDVVSRIVNLIKVKNELTEEDFEKVVGIYNEILDKEHYNGSAWYDFRDFKFSCFLWVFGYDSKWDSITGELTIIKLLPDNM